MVLASEVVLLGAALLALGVGASAGPSLLGRLLSGFRPGGGLPVDVRLVSAAELAPAPPDAQQTVFLMDLSARSADDLLALEPTYPFLPRLLARLAAANETLARDRFLYTHDLGEGRRSLVSLARIPSVMHQKLDLARRLAETLSLESAVVHVLGERGETVLDLDMSEALVSAIAVKRFPLPSLKRGAAQPESARFNLTVVCPSDLPTDGEEEAAALDSGQSSNSGLSGLERAMIEAAARRFESPQTTPPAERPTRSSVARHLERWQRVAEGTNLARALAVLPPNVLTPRAYADWVQELAADLDMCVELVHRAMPSHIAV